MKSDRLCDKLEGDRQYLQKTFFYGWPNQNVKKSQEFPDHWTEEAIAVDGKSLRSTVKNYDNAKQNFIVILSLFGQSSGRVLRINCFESQESSEIHKTQDAISNCSLKEEVLP